ncbi:hypothetical protein QJS10_CPA05g01460 [Acorus calamus]|uniref:Uncharacterized protein n=1 Tax=Acorus calamus TaxID=4465 RepID=A0AAV9EVC0_ACOCL|nr:hypothetical protein QJS10_CPA05g01460 [Acorus calamus]
MVLLEKTTVASSALAIYEAEVSAVGLVGKGEEEEVVEVPRSLDEALLVEAEVTASSSEKGKRSMRELAEPKCLIEVVESPVASSKGPDQLGSGASSSKGMNRSEKAVALKVSISQVAVLGGLEVPVQVEVLPSSRTNSYADTVKFSSKAASRWVPAGGGSGKGVTGSATGVSSGSPVVKSDHGEGSDSLLVPQLMVSRSEVLADVASSGVPPGCQLLINDGGSVPRSDDLSPVQAVDHGTSLPKGAETSPWEAASSGPSSLAEDISSYGEHTDGGLAVSKEEEAPLSAQGFDLTLVPFFEEVEDLLGSGSKTPKEVPSPVVVEPGEAEFLGSPGCEKATQIGVIFQNEGERFQFKSFLYKSKQESDANRPRPNQQNLS